MKNILKKNFKKIIKKILRKTQWRLKKIYINKSYTNQKPSLELISEIYNSKGIIHMGAHRGGEAPVYDWFHKKAIWIEANPIIINDLKDNISQFPNQKVIHALLSDKDNIEVNFNISNNDGASSSIFRFGPMSETRDLKMVSTIKMKSKKFDSIIKEKSINISEYDFWVLDLQGAELLALKGSTDSLKKCKSLYVEISKDEFYLNGTQWTDLRNYLENFYFYPRWEPQESHTDVLFSRKE